MIRILSLVFFCCALTSSVFAGERTLTESFDRSKPSYMKVDGRGDIWTAYYDLKGDIHVRNASGDRDLIVNEGRERASGLVLDVQGDNIYVAWREKIGGKKLWFRASHDGGKTLSEPILLDDGSAPLTRIKMGSDSRGNVFVVWYGEKKVDISMYNLYCTASNDLGKTFSEVKNLTPGYEHSVYPTLMVDEGGAYVFSDSMKKGKRFVIFRKTADGGKTWSEPLEILEIEGITTILLGPIRAGKRLHLFWLRDYGDNGHIVEGAYSDDDGAIWKTTVFEDTRGLDIGLLSAAYDSKGNIYLALYGKREEREKHKVYVMKSDDNGSNWGKPVAIRRYPFENTHATNPHILATDTGEVVVVWVDYRNIRSNLYMQFSKDYGRTWQEKDVPIEEPGKFNSYHYQFTESMVKVKDRYYELAYRFKGDLTMETADLILLDFKLDSGGAR